MQVNVKKKNTPLPWRPILLGQVFFLVLFVLHWQLKPSYLFLQNLNMYLSPMIMEPLGSFFLWGAWTGFAASIVMALFCDRLISAVLIAAAMQFVYGAEAGVIATLGQFQDLRASYFIEGALTYTAIFLFVSIPGACLGFLLRKVRQYLWG